jgi:signal transduction histidine kinase
MREDDDGVDIVVRDDGNGFDTGAAAMSPGFGRLGMPERIALVRGTPAVVSSPGKGAEIRARIPGRRRPAPGQTPEANAESGKDILSAGSASSPSISVGSSA